MFTHVRSSGCRNLEDRIGTYCRSADVPLMLLCRRRARISYRMLNGRNIESSCSVMKGMCEGGLRVVDVGVADQWPCCNKMCMLRAEVVEMRGNILSRMFSECDKEEACGCDR